MLAASRVPWPGPNLGKMHFNITIRAGLEQPRPLAETPGVSGGRSSKELWGHSHSTPHVPPTDTELPAHSLSKHHLSLPSRAVRGVWGRGVGLLDWRSGYGWGEGSQEAAAAGGSP